jgi:DNA-binding SARP family transcriptional activator
MNNYYIKWLNGLEISEDKKLSLSFFNKSSKMKNLLGLLLIKRNMNYRDDELARIIWPDRDYEDSKGDLDSLVLLTEKTLSEINKSEKFIIRENQRYCWNPKLNYIMDMDLVDADYKRLMSIETDNDEKIAIGKRIIDKYMDRVSDNYISSTWWFPISQYYNMIYINTVMVVCKLLEQKTCTNAYEEVVRIATKATRFDIDNINIYVHVFRGLKALNDKKGILNYYEAISALLQDKLSEGLNDEISYIYTWANNNKEATFNDLKLLTENLRENSNLYEIKGAYYCNRETFKNILHFIMRNKIREKKEVVLVLVTLKSHRNEGLNSIDVSKMEELKNTIFNNLRRNDLFVRYSINQYLILPYKCHRESVKRIESRLKKQIDLGNKDLFLDIIGFTLEEENYELIY